jgi:ubiquinone/menaquinone biosynthesis C-methylase UbiE
MIDTTYESSEQDQRLASTSPTLTQPKTLAELPAYMSEIYDWAYVDPTWVRRLDRNIVVKVLLFGNDRRLMHHYLKRISPGMRVWQVAHVYGDLVELVAKATGPKGSFDLTDITPIQIERANSKLAGLEWTRVIRADAGTFPGEKGQTYDLISSFFLLHEVPDHWKRAIVDNMLSQLPAGGEALFVDYHRPARWQPIRYILKWVNRVLEPFAESLWNFEISHFASEPDKYEWRKETLFGGVYQIVSVKHKKVP